MTIEVAISNVKMAMDAFPNQPEMIRLTIQHYEKLMEPAPKAKNGGNKKTEEVKPPKPAPDPAPKPEVKVLTKKQVKADLLALMKGRGKEFTDGINALAKSVAVECGYSGFPAVPETDKKCLSAVLERASSFVVPSNDLDDSGFEELPEKEYTKEDVVKVFVQLGKTKGGQFARDLRKEVSGKDSLGHVTEPAMFKELIDAARKVLAE